MHLMGPKMRGDPPFSLRYKSNWIFSCGLAIFEQNLIGTFCYQETIFKIITPQIFQLLFHIIIITTLIFRTTLHTRPSRNQARTLANPLYIRVHIFEITT
jgi:hypothetical protein